MSIVSHDPTVEAVGRMVLKAASCRSNILLQGESGVGKAFIAGKIHEASPMSAKGFFTLFCIPEEGTAGEEASLDDRIAGLEASYGTIYVRGVDLIGDLSQRCLLDYLDDRERSIERAGASHADFSRLIFSSQKNLKLEAGKGRFLRELYLRISVITIEIPPLREREDDVVRLARDFLSFYSDSECKRISGLSSEAESLLRTLSWEGNIHELRNAINQAVVLADEGEILSAGILKDVLSRCH